MSTVAFAVPPPTLLPESLQRAMLNNDTAVRSAQRDPTPAEGMSVLRARREEDVAPKEPVRAAPTLAQAEEDVLEVQLSAPSAPSLESMTVKQLKAYAAENGVSLQGLSSKKQMVQRLEAELR